MTDIYVVPGGHHSRTKHLLIANDEPDDWQSAVTRSHKNTTICGAKTAQIGTNGELKLNKVHRFTGFDQFPQEKWCRNCLDAFTKKYIDKPLYDVSRDDVLDMSQEAVLQAVTS